MTVKEFLNQHLTISHFYSEKEDNTLCFSGDLEKTMKEFAKYHVEEALKYASEEAVTINYGQDVSKDSILDAYPLENIK